MTSKEKYTDEVERMVKRYEEINRRAKTVIRKPTPEELKFYEEVLSDIGMSVVGKEILWV